MGTGPSREEPMSCNMVAFLCTGFLRILTKLSNGLEEKILKQPDPASHLAKDQALVSVGVGNTSNSDLPYLIGEPQGPL